MEREREPYVYAPQFAGVALASSALCSRVEGDRTGGALFIAATQ
jgi:hypothetical protein